MLTRAVEWIKREISARRGLVPQPEKRAMVHEVLDPASLHRWVEEMHDSVRGDHQLSEARYQQIYAELERADASPVSGASSEDGTQAYLPRDVNVSLVQSVFTECLVSRLEDLVKPLPPGHTSFAEFVQREVDPFKRFGPCDPGWAETLIAKGISVFEGGDWKFPDGRAPDVRLEPNARVVVVGDWGTGLKGAQDVGIQMGRKVADARRERRQVHVLHLGDVYYSGWKEEYERRFIPFWPVQQPTDGVSSWALNGNHDMYSGGRGYFGFLLRDKLFAAQNGSSYFRIGNDEWQLLGLDSAYKDFDLAGGQAAWVGSKLGESKRTMLLSHHEPFTSFIDDFAEPKMVARLREAIGSRTIDAWLWGHEHLCCVYDDDLHPYLHFGSCIGHGGVPVLPLGAKRPHLQWQFDGSELHADVAWQSFGFAVLDFDGGDLEITYWDQSGSPTGPTVQL